MPNYLFDTKHLIGKGSYGKVYLGKDQDSDKKVAVKRILYDKTSLDNLLSLYREVAILKHFDHPNIISLEQVTIDTALSQIDLIFEHMPCDLHSVIYSRMDDGSLQPLSDRHIDFFLYQILSAVQALHSKNIIHRDLKPQNILVNESCQIKLIDLGDARLVPDPSSQIGQRNLTRQRVTISYRAPEILVENTYGTQADMWSIGCILVELLLRKRIFYDRVNDQNKVKQVAFIFHLLGEPLPEKYTWIEKPDALGFIQGLCSQYKDQNKKPLSDLFEQVTPLQLSFLNGMLEFNPNLRMSAASALNCFSSEYTSETRSHLTNSDAPNIIAEKERTWRRYTHFERALDESNAKYKPTASNIIAMEALINKESKGLAVSRGTLFHHSSTTQTTIQEPANRQQQETTASPPPKAQEEREENTNTEAYSPR